MDMDFRADLLKYAQAELSGLGVEAPSNDTTDCTLLLFKLRRRCPEAIRRDTKFSASFSVPDDLKAGLSKLCGVIHLGGSLGPYLSRSTFNTQRHDQLLDDWGILHLHLGEQMQPNGMIESTQIVAFVLVTPDCVYFIEAYPHGIGHGDVWAKEQLIGTIAENWPSLLPSNGTRMTSERLTPRERITLRRKSVNATVAKPSGEVVFPPGGGFMSNKTAMADFMSLQKLYAQLDHLESVCRLTEDSIQHSLGFADNDFRLHVLFEERELWVYEPTSGTKLVFDDELTP